MKRLLLMAALVVATMATGGCETLSTQTVNPDGTPMTQEQAKAEQQRVAQERCNAAGDGLFFAQNALIIYAGLADAKPETVQVMQQGLTLLAATVDRVCTRAGLTPVSASAPQAPPPLPIMR